MYVSVCNLVCLMGGYNGWKGGEGNGAVCTVALYEADGLSTPCLSALDLVSQYSMAFICASMVASNSIAPFPIPIAYA